MSRRGCKSRSKSGPKSGRSREGRILVCAASASKLAWAGLILLATILCQAAHGADLLQAYRLAQNSDPTFSAARYALESAQQKIPEARAALLPTANVTGNDGDTHANTVFTDVTPVDRNMKSWAWTLQLTQPILRVGSVYAYRESRFVVEQAEAQYALAQQDLILRLAQAYFGVIVAQDAMAEAAAEVQALEEQLAQVEHGFALGTHAVTDVDETKARLGLARSQRIAARNDLQSKGADLEKVTGQPLDQLAVLSEAVMLPQPNPQDSQVWMDQARANHPSVRAQRAALSAAGEEINKNRSDHLPTIDLVASYGSNYASNSLTTPNDYSTRAKSRQVGLQLNVPVFAGGATHAKVMEAIANKDKAQADLAAASRQAASDAQQAFVGVNNAQAQVEALSFAIESGQRAVKGNQVGYRLGIRINLDVLNAQQQLYAAQRDLSKARYDGLLQGLKLKAAAGVLSEQDVLGVNALLVH
jgi:outer membrane protein